MTLNEEDYSTEDLVDLIDLKLIRHRNLKYCDSCEDDDFELTDNEITPLYLK